MNQKDFIFSSENRYPPILSKGTATSPAAKTVLTTGVPAGARFVIFAETKIFINGVATQAVSRSYGYIDPNGNLVNSFAADKIYWRVYGY